MRYDILLWECKISIESLGFNEQLLPLDLFGSVPLQIAQLASGGSEQPFKTMKDYKNWLSKLQEYVKWYQMVYYNHKIS
jgi:uncharacterized protein (DUF885 family)